VHSGATDESGRKKLAKEMKMSIQIAKPVLFWLIAASIGVMATQMQSVSAQMINVQSPFRTTGDNFYERNGINFGLNFPGSSRIVGLNPAGQLLPHIPLTQGTASNVVPAFGGYNPNASLRTGFTTLGRNPNISFGLELGKGSRRSISSQTPSVTMMNGQVASIFSGANRPFVTRIDPVIGMGSGWGFSLARRPGPASMNAAQPAVSASEPPPEMERTYSNPNTTATRGELSISDIRKQRKLNEMVQDQELLRELETLTQRANALVQQGKYGAARAKYGRALRKISDRREMQEAREFIQARLNELRDKR